MFRRKALIATIGLVLVGCDSDAPTVPSDAPPGDPEAGLAAFQAGCAACHAGGDGFDLAFFGFPASDIVRRGVAHVDSTMARDIVAYVQALGVEPVGPDFRLFQPGVEPAPSDIEFWRDLFQTEGWPEETITVEWLRSLDPRDLPVPIRFPPWSSESDESDWMPTLPLAVEILDAEGGTVRELIDAYFVSSDMPRLLAVVEAVRRITGNHGPEENPVCEGEAAAHTRPVACFEARRWIASLAATHLLRDGEVREIPFQIAQLWWEVGEAAVSVHFSNNSLDRTGVAAWLYMSSVFAPDGFPAPFSGLAENSGYMGQFLESEGRPRLAVLVTLLRMVQTGPLHEGRPLQAYWDLNLASLRAPHLLRPGVIEFGTEYLLAEQAEGHIPTGEDLQSARHLVTQISERFDSHGGTGDPQRDERIEELLRQLTEGLAPEGE